MIDDGVNYNQLYFLVRKENASATYKKARIPSSNKDFIGPLCMVRAESVIKENIPRLALITYA